MKLLVTLTLVIAFVVGYQYPSQMNPSQIGGPGMGPGTPWDLENGPQCEDYQSPQMCNGAKGRGRPCIWMPRGEPGEQCESLTAPGFNPQYAAMNNFEQYCESKATFIDCCALQG
eukprot:UN04351